MPGGHQEDPGTSAILAFRSTSVNVKEFARFHRLVLRSNKQTRQLPRSRPIISWPNHLLEEHQLADDSQSWILPDALIARPLCWDSPEKKLHQK
jgi:hypothetical protein